MITKEIKSLQHPIVKHLVKLRKEKKYRDEKKTLLIEGKKLLSEYQGPIHLLMTAEGTSIPSHLSPKMHFIVPYSIIEKISDARTPEPLLAEVPTPKLPWKEPPKRLLALDRISDPGNVGTLLRTALAFGFEGVFLIGGADPYGSKALRAAKGAPFHLPIQQGSEEELITLIETHQLTPIIADASGEAPSLNSPLILILGSEGEGPSETLKNYGKCIAIPMEPETESLNVAVAGGILMNKVREMQCQNMMTI